MDVEEILIKAKTLKESGNTEFKKGKMLIKHTAGKNSMTEACTLYAKALEQLYSLRNNKDVNALMSEKQDEELCQLMYSIYLNLSISGLFLESPDTALNSANAAINLDSTRAKGYYRKYQALVALDRIDEGFEALSVSQKLEPRNKDVRKSFKELKLKITERDRAEALRKETEQGRQRQELLKAEKTKITTNTSNTSSSTVSSLATTKAEEMDSSCITNFRHNDLPLTMDELIELCPTLSNGNITGKNNYIWGQNLQTLVAYFLLPHKSIHAKDLNVEIHRLSCRINWIRNNNDENNTKNNDNETLLFGDTFEHPIKVDEAIWMIETPGVLCVNLVKDNSFKNDSDCTWWERFLRSETPIDTSLCRLNGDFSQLPAERLRSAEKEFHIYQSKSPEEQAELDRLASMKDQMQMEYIGRMEAERKAMKDPKKAALAEMFKQNFPDIPIAFK